jgi:hypothetical protein
MLYMPTNHAKVIGGKKERKMMIARVCRNEPRIHLAGSVGRARRLDQTRDVSATH